MDSLMGSIPPGLLLGAANGRYQQVTGGRGEWVCPSAAPLSFLLYLFVSSPPFAICPL